MTSSKVFPSTLAYDSSFRISIHEDCQRQKMYTFWILSMIHTYIHTYAELISGGLVLSNQVFVPTRIIL
jgi:hypothetical protein